MYFLGTAAAAAGHEDIVNDDNGGSQEQPNTIYVVSNLVAARFNHILSLHDPKDEEVYMREAVFQIIKFDSPIVNVFHIPSHVIKMLNPDDDHTRVTKDFFDEGIVIIKLFAPVNK